MNQILLINVSGRDQPGLAAGLIGVLADYGVAVLDIGQASIHAELSLGFMVEVPADVNSAMVRKELLFKAHEFKVQVSFTEISAVRYAK
ncbi:MAG: phosphoserine phosphatase SerB, partial [Gammaproteobacteria bacterium]|nr:phosphoserine phosphatase SerB [Gammaproteobacteria bacterium]